MPFPLALTEHLGHWGSYIVFLLIGVGFGAALEMSGFGKSTKLAAQFYFKDLTVLKVMFGAIVVAMVLVFLTSALGLLDYNLVWVNTTYFWPGVLGGLIMGVGFILGGFCPGTSLVAAATAKLDGVFFVLGGLFGMFLFGETVSKFETFWYSSYEGRWTFQDLLGVDVGIVVLGVVLMALFVFWGAEKLEQIIGGKGTETFPKWRYGAAGTVVVVALAVLVLGQPTTEDRWNKMADEKEAALANREVQIHPAELLATIGDRKLKAYMIDVRPEAEFNLFHILDARHIPLNAIPGAVATLHMQPENTVFIVMSNDERAATEAWKILVAESVPNVYILEGGVNHWIDTFADENFKAEHALPEPGGDDTLNYVFGAALGSTYRASVPRVHEYTLVAYVEPEEGAEGATEDAAPVEMPESHGETLVYIPKVKLEIKRGPSAGGCGG